MSFFQVNHQCVLASVLCKKSDWSGGEHFQTHLKGSTSLWRDISRYSCLVHYASGSVLVDALKTSVALMTLSADGGHNAALKQMCSREVSKIHNKKCAFSSTSQQQLKLFFCIELTTFINTSKTKKSVVDLHTSTQQSSFQLQSCNSNRLDVKVHFASFHFNCTKSTKIFL